MQHAWWRHSMISPHYHSIHSWRKMLMFLSRFNIINKRAATGSTTCQNSEVNERPGGERSQHWWSFSQFFRFLPFSLWVGDFRPILGRQAVQIICFRVFLGNTEAKNYVFCWLIVGFNFNTEINVQKFN